MSKYLLILLLFLNLSTKAENGYELWLRYAKIEQPTLSQQYITTLGKPFLADESATSSIIRKELLDAMWKMTGKKIEFSQKGLEARGLHISLLKNLPSGVVSSKTAAGLGEEGYALITQHGKTYITSHSSAGLLYGVFHLLRLMQMHQPIQSLHITESPKITLRLLNHWDNLNRTVERGYAGFSIWDWHKLPDYIDKRYVDYARANASIGINGTVLTNVNANASILTQPYLTKVKALADLFRPYGIRIYLTARFSAPIEIGKLKTADPLNESVRNWWKDKVKEIYSIIPDFGGFLVKANSEGQPGPQDYGRHHADGANMLAEAVAPYKGIIMWRAFVYSQQSTDRFKQAYEEFKPLDGKFNNNVIVQVKNGPIDFQPREPFSPLFGAMHHTPLMMEYQLTQEYLGQGTHLVYEAPLFKEVLQAETFSKGPGSTVEKVVTGKLDNFKISGMAGVSNIGNDIDWCGHPFAQSNWYALGRLAWNPELSAESIAEEWIRQSFSNKNEFLNPIRQMMISSREAVVNYMTPLGLAHIMYNGHHYGPMPWGNSLGRPDWNPVYYHKADSVGIGFNRTASGSDALSQYAPALRKQLEDPATCPDSLLLWFHHVSWKHRMKNGKSLWEEMCFKYQEGVDTVKSFGVQWEKAKPYVDEERHREISQLLAIQLKDAIWWRNACLLYFQTFSQMEFPAGVEKPDHNLEYYQNIRIINAPGN